MLDVIHAIKIKLLHFVSVTQNHDLDNKHQIIYFSIFNYLFINSVVLVLVLHTS